MLPPSRLSHHCFVLFISYRFRFLFLYGIRSHNTSIMIPLALTQWRAMTFTQFMSLHDTSTSWGEQCTEHDWANVSHLRMFRICSFSILTVALLSSMCCLCFGFVTTKFRCSVFGAQTPYIQFDKIQTYTQTTIRLHCFVGIYFALERRPNAFRWRTLDAKMCPCYNEIGGKLYFMCECVLRSECPMSVANSPSSILSKFCWLSFNFLFKEK